MRALVSADIMALFGRRLGIVISLPPLVRVHQHQEPRSPREFSPSSRKHWSQVLTNYTSNLIWRVYVAYSTPALSFLQEHMLGQHALGARTA
ncbi:hypothetical protein F751_6086 [Auxenochlorella protothecoides]|uniref:Uncharacterized protein n=1 Tax=Auxenochlorella protothecoides TaxID=3075 RepID=A0A087SP51_AUXPR|nr:hypothetical protein F751_6086 [Auxenochlorella protothecoides]KFM27505.1 hypothetical protein F751_6086 [Auxenochlorella protothecoides]